VTVCDMVMHSVPMCVWYIGLVELHCSKLCLMVSCIGL